ncbi:MAG: glutathione peroxidase [Candidatus Hydrogenedentes bacterium]|nr:glutathione peroxidase [Candidatus Hydrogenedentota bacterium]
MSRLIAYVAVVAVAVGASAADKKDDEESANDKPAAASVLDFTVKDIDGKETKLGDKFNGKVLLIVNTASKCGYTPQYTDLEAVYKKYHDQGLEVLAFPSNDFGAQEPGTNDEIKTFCSSKYDVTFPLFSKIPVKGDDKDPLYAYLTDSSKHPATGGDIKWNFTKFLVGRDGKVVARYEPKVKPTDTEVTEAVEKALAAKTQ